MVLVCAVEMGEHGTHQKSAGFGPRAYLFFNLPFGSTEVTGAMGLVDGLEASCGRLVSFLGFFAILLLRCSPLAMVFSSFNWPM